MPRRLLSPNITLLTVFIPLIGLFVPVLASQDVTALLDPSRHITIDEIKPGMEAYCLTVYEGTKIEKFPLEVLSVVKNFDPGFDIILVKGTDERFKYTGAVAGCSGSPVYIQGRLAGALALGWPQSKDALYGVTPIENMLQVGSAGLPRRGDGTAGGGSSNKSAKMLIDLSGTIKLDQIEKQLADTPGGNGDNKDRMTFLPCPLVVSGIPSPVCEALNDQLSGYGIMATPGFSGSITDTDTADVKIEPGSVLSVPVVSGDIEMAVMGTATEVIGDEVFGFGHSFLGYGPVELPMATGQIHTVIASRYRSFKLGSPLDIVGTITADQSRAVYGKIGAKPTMIGLNINIKRYNATSPVLYNCKTVYNRIFTPLVTRIAVLGAAMRQGPLPPENTINYKLDFETADYGTITFENISAESGLAEISMELNTTIALLMNNPYKEIKIKEINCDIEIEDTSSLGRIYSTSLSDYTVKPGDDITVDVTVEKFRGSKEDYSFTLNVPKDLKGGKYKLLITGGRRYQDFLYRTVPQRFLAENADALIKAIKYISKPKRNKLHCIMPLPQGGITIQRAELPDLPPTKTLILTYPKRTLDIQTYKHWLEESIKTDTVIINEREIEFEVIR